jgi:tellurite resistance protein
MPERDAFQDRERGLEEEYFRKREKALIEKFKQQVAQETERKQLVEATGVSDQKLLDTLQELGFTPDTARLLHLVPLVQVAWVDGDVTKSERDMIMEAAGLYGVEPNSSVYQQLTTWLDRCPTDQFFESALLIVRAMLQALPAEEQASSEQELVALCTRLAKVSGGVFGIGSISSKEQALLEHITTELTRTREAAVGRALKG